MDKGRKIECVEQYARCAVCGGTHTLNVTVNWQTRRETEGASEQAKKICRIKEVGRMLWTYINIQQFDINIYELFVDVRACAPAWPLLPLDLDGWGLRWFSFFSRRIFDVGLWTSFDGARFSTLCAIVLIVFCVTLIFFAGFSAWRGSKYREQNANKNEMPRTVHVQTAMRDYALNFYCTP